jgi:hypothetical protein
VQRLSRLCGATAALETHSSQETRSTCGFSRRLSSSGATGIERIEVARGDRDRGPTGAQIVGLHVRLVGRELNGTPAAPAAFVAAIGLAIGHPVADGLVEAAQSRRMDAG